MDLLKSFVGSSSALKDTAKLVVIGSTVEATRRASTSAWNSFVDSFFLTAHFSQEDYPYDWLLHWLVKQPSYSASREFDVGSFRPGNSSAANEIDDEDDTEELPGKRKRAIAFLPSLDVTHSIFYHGHWLKITRTRGSGHYGGYHELRISVIARNNNILKTLVLQARREYEADMEHRVHVFLAESTSWRWNGAHQKRPLSSVVLEPGVKDMLIADAKDFLASESWYADRGIPYRRGYLLYGVPGSGKTSLIHAIAGELSLDIYVVSLSAKGMSDTTLTTLLGRVPSRCILLLEDLDAAFTRSVTRDAKSTGIPTTAATTTTSTTSLLTTVPVAEDPNTLSLSGLLNSLDGVAASTGRLLFATTNHVERLDPALTRPGRLDVHVDFKHASKWQAEGIFKNFFPTKPKPSEEGEDKEPVEEKKPAKRTKPSSRQLAPLLEEEELAHLAKQFAAAIPEDEMSVAGLQGYLLRNKTRPREAVTEVGAWIEKERETKAKLKKQKEEEEARIKKEAEEKEVKEKKEKEDAEAKAKEEKAAAEKKEKEEKDAERRRLRRSKRKPVKSEQAKADSDSDSEAETGAPNEVVSPPSVVEITEPSSKGETSDSTTAPLSESSSALSTAPETTSSEEGSSTGQSDDSATSEVESDRSVDGEAPVAADPKSAAKWVAVQAPEVAASTIDTTA